MTVGSVHFVVPDGIDDAERVSGGNVYDRRIRDGLRARGIGVRMVPVPVGGALEIARALSALPSDSLVLIDGLIAVAASRALDAQSARLRIVVLAHMVASTLPGAAEAAEREALRAARHVIATSGWTRSELIARGLAESNRITIARPGTDAAPPAAGSGSGGRLLCVGAIAAHKGQDVLVRALAGMADLPGWTCSIVGSPAVEPDFAAGLSAVIESAGLSTRVALTGVLTGRRLADAYAAADLVVAPSRAESYGMVVAEALARGLPVVASRVGGIPEAAAGSAAGVLVPPDDPSALRTALRRWLEDAGWRAELRAEALRARAAARGWDETVELVAEALDAVAAVGHERRHAG